MEVIQDRAQCVALVTAVFNRRELLPQCKTDGWVHLLNLSSS
jgi:hypothetical protein